MMAPQRVKTRDLDSALQRWKDIVAGYNKKSATIGEVQLTDDIKRRTFETMVPENLERHLQLNGTRLKRCDEVRI